MDISWIWATYLSLGMLSISLLLAFVRLVRGPTLPDRVVVLDLVAYQIIAATGIYTIHTGFGDYLDVALALGLITFLGTIAFARYLERTHKTEEAE